MLLKNVIMMLVMIDSIRTRRSTDQAVQSLHHPTAAPQQLAPWVDSDPDYEVDKFCALVGQ